MGIYHIILIVFLALFASCVIILVGLNASDRVGADSIISDLNKEIEIKDAEIEKLNRLLDISVSQGKFREKINKDLL